MIIPVTYYKCDKCNRIYETDPEKCKCERCIYVKGELIGPFIIEGQEEDDKRNILCKCILCGTFVAVHYTNVKKQKSCGCKPRHILFIELTKERFIYECKKCGKQTMGVPPIVTYCCEDLLNDLHQYL